MATNIVIPKLGMTMTEAKIAKWKASEGDWIEKKQTVVVIETEKVTYEVEALAEGFLCILAEPGTKAAVGQAIGMLAETEDELAKLQAEKPEPTVEVPEMVEPSVAAKAAVATESKVEPRIGNRIKITPSARKLAQKHNLDLTKITGSGPGGRIKREDIERVIAEGEVGVVPKAAILPGELIDGKRVKQSIPLSGTRQVIAEHMLRSLQISAQLSSGIEVDMTEMVRFRNAQKKRTEFQEHRLSYTDLFVFIVATVLKEQPLMNSSLVDGEIKIWDDINIGVAAAVEINELESSLFVPVVKNADRLSLFEINQAVTNLVKKAREGILGYDEMVGGTFTLTNTGTFGARWSWSTPVINQPESAIIQTGAITDRPVAINGDLVIRPVMPLNITFDHRIIDGLTAAKFLFRLADLMEQPYQLIG